MINLSLKRIASSKLGTFGVLIDGNEPFAVTLEKPWWNNESDISSIPAEKYICKRTVSPHFGDVFEITGVANREHILIHKGNTTADTLGCVLVAEQFNRINGVPGISASGEGFKELMEKLKGEQQFILEITNA